MVTVREPRAARAKCWIIEHVPAKQVRQRTLHVVPVLFIDCQARDAPGKLEHKLEKTLVLGRVLEIAAIEEQARVGLAYESKPAPQLGLGVGNLALVDASGRGRRRGRLVAIIGGGYFITVVIICQCGGGGLLVRLGLWLAFVERSSAQPRLKLAQVDVAEIVVHDAGKKVAEERILVKVVEVFGDVETFRLSVFSRDGLEYGLDDFVLMIVA